MSIPVPLDELGDALARHRWGYLVTVGDDGRAHTLAVPTDWRDGTLRIAAGRTTRANAAARPGITMVFPGATGAEYSLIVDGTAAVHDDGIAVTPTHGVLHRPALPGPAA